MAALTQQLWSWLERKGEPPALRGSRITPRRLSRSFHQAMFLAGEGTLGLNREDFEQQDEVQHALFAIWDDYRKGAPQTLGEKALGRALAHIATAYVEPRQ